MSALRLFDKFAKLLDVTWTSIADGQTLKRSGSNIIGYTPGGGSGDVVGPTSAVSGNVASYNGTTGKLIQDSARPVTDIVLGQTSSVDSEVALFSGTGGKTIKRATGTGMVRVLNGVYQTPAGELPRGCLQGLITSNAVDTVNDVTIGTGECRNDTDTDDLVLGSAITKRLDAVWAVGTNQGGADTATALTNSFYHLFLIKRPDTGVVDALFSPSVTPTMPTNYTVRRRICSFWRSIAGGITNWYQEGDEFWFKLPASDANNTAVGTTTVTPTLSAPGGGIKTTAIFMVYIGKTPAAAFQAIVSPGDASEASAVTYWNLAAVSTIGNAWGQFYIRTNTSGQIRIQSSIAGCTFYITTSGFVDQRGRFD